MTDSVPSKEEVDRDADYIELLRASDPVEALKRENERLRRELAGFKPMTQEDLIAHAVTATREPPHCSSCSCGMTAPEPPVKPEAFPFNPQECPHTEHTFWCNGCGLDIRNAGLAQPPGVGNANDG
jgi:hypothetical protein